MTPQQRYVENDRERMRSQKKAYRERNPEKVKSFNKEWRDKNWLRRSLLASRSTALKKCQSKGIPFSLTIEDMYDLHDRCAGRCEITGIAFERTSTPGHTHPKSPSVDRIDPKLGYVLGNVRVILQAVNALKGNGTDDMMFEIVDALQRYRDGQERKA